MRVKICGITNLDDALLACKLDAWAIGFNFYKKSPRYIDPKKALEIVRELPENVEKVGIFVESSPEIVKEIYEKVGLTSVQLYNSEVGEYPGQKILCHHNQFDSTSDLYLLDVNDPQFGGTGKKSNWEQAAILSKEVPLILAGGINSENICEALGIGDFYALDICSGVELEKGTKCPTKLNQLFENLRRFYV